MAQWFATEITGDHKKHVATFNRDGKSVFPKCQWLHPVPMTRDMIKNVGEYVKAVLDRNFLHGGNAKKEQFLDVLHKVMEETSRRRAEVALKAAKRSSAQCGDKQTGLQRMVAHKVGKAGC